MKVDWLREAAEAVRLAAYPTDFQFRRIGLQVTATVPGGYWRESYILGWDMLEIATLNPLPQLVDHVNQLLGRQLARGFGEPAVRACPAVEAPGDEDLAGRMCDALDHYDRELSLDEVRRLAERLGESRPDVR